MSQVLYQPFDIQTHKKHFINYLEVVILEDGVVEYAIPSHQEKLIAIACQKHTLSREELDDMCPIEYYGDFITWLSMMAGAIPVWNQGVKGKPNEQQLKTILQLKDEGLYEGLLPE